MRTLIMRVISELGDDLLHDANLVRDSSFELERPLSKEVANAIKTLWETAPIKKAYEARKEYYLPECASFLFENVDRFAAPDYLPSEEDCLRVRKRTCGVVEYTFVQDKINFRIIDVGGQRSERRKWLVAFEGFITAVIYCIAVDEYDMNLAEATGVNRMLEALQLFADVTATGVLQSVPIILFFNKVDLLKEKLQTGSTPANIFNEYKGGQDFDACMKFLQQKFMSVAPETVSMYPHHTCAIDRENIRFVWRVAKDLIMKENVSALGL